MRYVGSVAAFWMRVPCLALVGFCNVYRDVAAQETAKSQGWRKKRGQCAAAVALALKVELFDRPAQ
jgi:hypothetical protein